LKEPDANHELRGLGDLLTLVVERATAPVEGMHRAIANRSLRWTGSTGEATSRTIDSALARMYEAIRATGSALGKTVGLSAIVTRHSGELISRSPLGSRVQAVINATLGDELEHRGNELRIEMSLRNPEGGTVLLTPEDLAFSFASATPRLVVLVHGLGRTEGCWLGKDEDGTAGLWDRLAADSSVTPVLIRYNSGRRVSDNGAELARLLERLWRSWPMPIETMALVGHSMGGLVIRSACHAGKDAQHGWLDAVDQVITVGTPHLGAPLEKAANVVSWGLRVTPESRPLAELLDARSVGIKDLRFGAIVEHDWRGAEPDALLNDTVSDIPAPEGVDQHFVAAVITSDPAHPIGALLGDLMVRVASGTGRGRRRRIEATEVRVLTGRRHFNLLHDREVVDQVLDWLTKSTSSDVLPRLSDRLEDEHRVIGRVDLPVGQWCVDGDIEMSSDNRASDGPDFEETLPQ
jgi:pimeloyl-ACP methyl ester carboxylesterase